MKTLKKTLESLARKALLASTLLFSGCFTLTSFETEGIHHDLKMRSCFDIARVKNHIGSEKRTFEPPRNDEEGGKVGGTTYPCSAKVGLEDSIGLDENSTFRLNLGTNLYYSLLNEFASKTTGYNALPWDVTYFAGIVPKKTIEPYLGLSYQLDEDWNLSLAFGLPSTKFRWKKSYEEQLTEKIKTIERDAANKLGKSIHLEVRYNIRDTPSTALFVELSNSFYNNVQIAGEETDIEVGRFNIGLEVKH